MLNVLNYVTDFMFMYYIDEKLKFLINVSYYLKILKLIIHFFKYKM